MPEYITKHVYMYMMYFAGLTRFERVNIDDIARFRGTLQFRTVNAYAVRIRKHIVAQCYHRLLSNPFTCFLTACDRVPNSRTLFSVDFCRILAVGV